RTGLLSCGDAGRRAPRYWASRWLGIHIETLCTQCPCRTAIDRGAATAIAFAGTNAWHGAFRVQGSVRTSCFVVRALRRPVAASEAGQQHPTERHLPECHPTGTAVRTAEAAPPVCC